MSGEAQDNWEDMDVSTLNQRMNSLVCDLKSNKGQKMTVGLWGGVIGFKG
jgi:hypothetical protein